MSKIFLHGLLMVALFNNVYAGIPNEHGVMLYTNENSNEQININGKMENPFKTQEKINNNPYLKDENRIASSNSTDEVAAAPVMINGITPYGDAPNTSQSGNSNQSNITVTPSNPNKNAINKIESVQNINNNNLDIDEMIKQLNAAINDNNMSQALKNLELLQNCIKKQQNNANNKDTQQILQELKLLGDFIKKQLHENTTKIEKVIAETTEYLDGAKKAQFHIIVTSDGKKIPMCGNLIDILNKMPSTPKGETEQPLHKLMEPTNIIYPSKQQLEIEQARKECEQRYLALQQKQQAMYNSFNYNNQQYNNNYNNQQYKQYNNISQQAQSGSWGVYPSNQMMQSQYIRN